MERIRNGFERCVLYNIVAIKRQGPKGSDKKILPPEAPAGEKVPIVWANAKHMALQERRCRRLWKRELCDRKSRYDTPRTVSCLMAAECAPSTATGRDTRFGFSKRKTKGGNRNA
jgi:hypothetical protein